VTHLKRSALLGGLMISVISPSNVIVVLLMP